MFKRNLIVEIEKAALDYPVVTITGPRQSGKTTLARMAFPKKDYVNLEDPETRRFAVEDPKAFLEKHEGGVIIDETHKAPELFSYIQILADKRKKNGQFILTGSHHFLLLEAISQSLAGRAAIYHLLPLSAEELKKANIYPRSLNEIIMKGCYPRIYDQNLDPYKWYGNYVNTYLERDVRSIQKVDNLILFQRFMKLVAARSGCVLNYANIANDLGMSNNTVKGWLSILDASFITFLLPPYYRNFNKRVIKSPKVFFYDTGLLCYLLDIQDRSVLDVYPLRGQIFETLIVSDLMKQYYHHGLRPRLYFWRDKTGHEIDCLVEKGTDIYPIEIKSSQTVNNAHFDQLAYWEKLTGGKKSFLIYAGSSVYKRHGCDVLPYDHIERLIAEK